MIMASKLEGSRAKVGVKLRAPLLKPIPTIFSSSPYPSPLRGWGSLGILPLWHIKSLRGKVHPFLLKSDKSVQLENIPWTGNIS